MATDPGEHYRYELVYRDPKRPATGVRAIVNEGHNGSVLNCAHPVCVAVREDSCRSRNSQSPST